MKNFLIILGCAIVGGFFVWTSGNSIKQSELCDLATQQERDSIENNWHLQLQEEIRLYKQAEDSIQLLMKQMRDTLAQKHVLIFSSKELNLPKGEIIEMYPPNAKYRDLEKTQLYAIIRDSNNVSRIALLNAKQWLMLKPKNIIK